MEKSGFVHVPGPLMKKLLFFYGASWKDLHSLEAGYVHAMVPRDPEPVMEYRQVAFHRILIEPKDRVTIKDKENKRNHCCDVGSSESFNFVPAMTQAVTQIPQKEIASTSEEGSKLHFKRSGTRYWPLPPASYAAESSVPGAMVALNSGLLPAKHQAQININHEHKTTLNDQILVRTQRKPLTDESYSPTPEGIHQDNSEISSVTLVCLHGVKSGGESRLWTLDTPAGNYSEDDFNNGVLKNNLLLNHALRDPWETLYFNDRMVKHEARAFDGDRPCTRDVIVNFLRKPLNDGHDKKVVGDSLVSI